MFCPNCGKNCLDGSKFCDGCGTAFANPQPNQQQNYYNNQQNGYQQPPYQQNYYNNQQNGYQQPPYQQNGFGNYPVPIKKRDLAVCIILSIVTCGIYGIYWMICLADDLNVASGRVGDTSGGTVFLLSLVTCGIYSLFWIYKAGEKVAYIKQRNTGERDSSSAVLYLVLALFGFAIIDYALIQSELNKVATLQ